ncbi:Muramoyltetrapeptide carboxypeptidase [Ignavibacterium album JCM 16511]|uniref:Muramoyltetrapeptide carboxypeptidase n=1 Tax=Ignavibacterium album (strain DSM 19864 / JCM 16511 / NBRC 101810 / Mat9-16) TaxID=945713 RepID=I0AMW8_IGNAJ|nr:LD-carboxypeptidase [Ignavibacterium album]AFH50325.1 Muramoyltetrapeptide carboxypeptidase [Ignavibacterium album JCM 16511]
MDRKKFIHSLTAVTALSTLPSGKVFSFSNVDEFSSEKISVIKPNKLKEGDRIALVAPGSYISETELQDSVKNLSDLGFQVTFSERLTLQNGYFSGTDQQRADDLMDMFEREDVDAIMCVRGGYGCARILPLLDYSIIKKHPKILIGYSDVTALLYGIFRKTGLITFHGPVATSTFNDFSVDNFKSVLMDKSPNKKILNANPSSDENIYGVRTLVKGIANGRLVGGNLSIMVSLIGTKYDVDYANKIIFIEEIDEEPYRIDRMLTQLIQADKFKNASGVMMGIFSKCEPKEKDASFSKSFSLMEVLTDRFSGMKIPVIYGMSFGHVKDKFTIPFGALAELDTNEQTFTLLESAVK